MSKGGPGPLDAGCRVLLRGTEYFEEYDGWLNPHRAPGRPYCCSTLKGIAVRQGVFMSARQDLLFTNAAQRGEGHMPNCLIGVILKLFISRYKVPRHTATRERIETMAAVLCSNTSPAPAADGVPSAPRTGRRQNRGRFRAWHRVRDEARTNDRNLSAPKPTAPSDWDELPPSVVEDAVQLDTHEAMLDICGAVIPHPWGPPPEEECDT
ncbi:hypothetical protein BV20DRAFT_982906 [Pilatotrama ljubarskyi]|nr:hypothetical protein BV20DRAFT_982906 [Pilatotrama ljubarskyi]